jgi:DNA-binding transcriptional ArsR family regulator
MDTFSALADSNRRKIIELVAKNGTMSMTEILDNFEISQPAISQHLKVLREANLLEMEKQAQKHLYKINPATFLEMEKWMHRMTKVWNERFDRLDKVLEVMQDHPSLKASDGKEGVKKNG